MKTLWLQEVEVLGQSHIELVQVSPVMQEQGRKTERRVCLGTSVMSDSLWPHGSWPARLLWPWDSPGKNTGVGCHFLLQWWSIKWVKCMKWSRSVVSPWTAAYPAPPSMGFSGQEYWSGLPLPSPEERQALGLKKSSRADRTAAQFCLSSEPLNLLSQSNRVTDV